MMTDRSERYACPDCGTELIAASGDGPDGQPKLWWCTNDGGCSASFDPRDVTLSPFSAAPPTENFGQPDLTATVQAQPAPTPTPEPVAVPALHVVPDELTEAAHDVASTITLEKVAPGTYTLPDPSKDRGLYDFAMCRMALRRSQKVLLYGPPGTGKSSLAAMLELLGRKLVTIQMTPETPMFELRGRPIVKNNDVVWEHGPVNLAMLNGWRVLFDEIDQTGPDAMSYMYAALDDLPKLRRSGLTLPNGDTIFPHTNYQVVGTMNGHPDRLLPAIKSRLSVALEIKHPLPDVVNLIAPDLRNAAINCVLDGKTSTREWINVTHLREALADEGLIESDAHKAAGQLVFGDRWKEMIGDIAIGTSEEPAEAEANA